LYFVLPEASFRFISSHLLEPCFGLSDFDF